MTRVSTGRLALQYMLYLMVALVAVMGLIWALRTCAGVDVRKAAMSFAIIFAATSATGSFWYGHEGRAPGARLWRVALVCALLTITLQVAAIFLFLWGGVDMQSLALVPRNFGFVAGMLGLVAVLQLLAIRVGLGVSMQRSEKRAAARAAKAGR